MRLRILAALGCAVFAVGTSSIVASCEEFQSASQAAVASGDYKPLTFWTSVSLGTSYYTNPHKAQTINVAYSFDGPEFSNEFKSAALFGLAQQGKISFGITDKAKNTISVISFADLKKSFYVSQPADLTKVLARDDVSIVASDKVLLGEASKAPVVKTETAQK